MKLYTQRNIMRKKEKQLERIVFSLSQKLEDTPSFTLIKLRQKVLNELIYRDELKNTCMILTKEHLLDLLTYDSEEAKFLLLYERCLIHKEIIRQYNGNTPKEFSKDLQIKLIRIHIEIRQTCWTRPVFRIERDLGGGILKIKMN